MAKTKPASPKIDKIQEAQKLLAEENKKRMTACMKEIEQVLTKYNAGLQATPSQIFLAPKSK